MLGRGIVTVLACSLFFSAGAAAQSNRPDPNSPAGVEYELPLDQTRKDLSDDGPRGGDGGSGGGGGGSESGDGQSGAAPLFGAGISRAASDGGSSADGGSQRGSGGSNGDDQATADGPNGSTDNDGDGSDPALAEASTGDGGGTGLLIPGLVLLVVLAGGAMGLLLRRGLGGASSS